MRQFTNRPLAALGGLIQESKLARKRAARAKRDRVPVVIVDRTAEQAQRHAAVRERLEAATIKRGN